MNSIFVIKPYKGITWVFDDPARGLLAEPFVMGMDTIIDQVVKAKTIPGAADGFMLMFSANKLPINTVVLGREESDGGGTWYQVLETNPSNMVTQERGWLCPALLQYFDEPPEYIYVYMQSLLQ